ncbi:hypothetical protein EZI54_01555 [Marinobacter halodurans]|uniref:Anti-sigma factor n=1 Tax=Marinobacter halodurans TaxID=2528979 RepID=A0ABY1ZQ03_9GAMM|nr:hypothetical protein [Marinobacter halodurans]TBW59028.1 hypothetical protein EZI54_01555 [Marinobacter halodurans]
MTITDETLSAFLDAELPEAEMQAVRERVRNDPALSDRLAALAAVDSQLSRHYSAIDDEPMPTPVTDLLAQADSGAANVVAFPAWRRWSRGIRRNAGIAVAAVLVMALGVAQWFSGAPDRHWQTVAQALESAPSGTALELEDGRTLTPRLTFRNHQGEFCRQFQLQDTGQASENIACRRGGDWTLAVEKQVAASPDATGYRPASGGSVLDRALDRMMDGGAFTADQERRLIKDGWSDAGHHGPD